MTAPFSADFVTQLKRATAWRLSAQLETRFTPRFFCCTDPNEMGLSPGKEPVAVLTLEPNPCFVGDTVSFDGADSYDPDGSITDYNFTFPSGTPSTSTSSSGTVTWAAAGEYEVSLVVEDGTGLRSQPARRVMQVVDPGGAYFIGTSAGVFFTGDGGQTWTAQNTGLSGDALTVYALAIDPATQNLDHDNKTIWAATAGGLYVSNDADTAWVIKNPASVNNSWGDTPAPTVDDLAFRALCFVGDRLFAVATWQNGSSAWRSWIFYADVKAIRTDLTATITWSEL